MPRGLELRRGHLWLRLAVVGGTLLVLLGSLELVFHALAFWQHRVVGGGESWAVYDAELGYLPRPFHKDSNEHGLRDDPVEPVKSRFRLLFLGDSLGFYGKRPADTYVGRLEEKIQAIPDLRPVEVINASVRGYTNYQELLYLKRFGIGFEPDLVGVGFVLNDLHRILHRFVLKNGEVAGEDIFAPKAVEVVDDILYRLARRSLFLTWLRRRVGLFGDLVDLYSAGGYTFEYRHDLKPAWDEEPWAEVERQLAEMVGLGREHGFSVFLVSFPFGEQYRADYLAADPAYVLKPQRKLGEICARLGIRFLDLYPALNGKRHFSGDRIHLNEAGREVAAERIVSFLLDAGLLPQAPS